jgi:5'-nucleotidase
MKSKKKAGSVRSGVNHGSNSSINVIYSGTMSAAVEAGIEGIPALAFPFRLRMEILKQ